MRSIKNRRILLIEDHRDLAETILDFLETMGCIVDYAADGLTGLHLSKSKAFDVILLDVMLPGMDGLEVCKAIREQIRSPVPVLMITARDELNDKLIGFEAGADDYLVKPFELPELVARISALIRRNEGQVTSEILRVADLELNMATVIVMRDERVLNLSPACFKILALLMKNSPSIVTREELETALWGEDIPTSDTLRSQIYKLRKQVDKPFPTSLIQTAAGIGYRVVSESN